MIKCYILARGLKIAINVLLDTGAGLTLVKRKIAKALNLKGVFHKLKLSVAGGATLRESRERLITFQLMSLNEAFCTIPLRGVTCAAPTSPFPPVRLDPSKAGLESFKFTMNYPQTGPVGIDLILSTQTVYSLQIGPIIQTHYDIGPRVLRTRLGDVLCGSYWGICPPSERPEHVKIAKAVLDDSFDFAKLRDFMKLEQMGLVEEDSDKTVAEMEAEERFFETLKYSEQAQQYEVGLLWKKGMKPEVCLDDNLNRAIAVCKSFKRKSLNDETQARCINEAYMLQLNMGMAEIVPPNEWRLERPTYTIPTHPVYKASSSSPVRIVQNASSVCASTGYSLNDCLHIGENLLPDLARLILKFRQTSYVLVTDVSKMFWRVKVSPEDRYYLRYVWQFEPAGDVTMLQALVTAFGLNDSPYKCIKVVLEHAKRHRKQFVRAAKALLELLYMDDVTAIDNDIQELAETAKELLVLLNMAGMPTHKWNSNDHQVLDLAGIPSDLRAVPGPQKYLGLSWDSQKDVITFTFDKLLKHPDGKATKRSMISELASCFDPMGYVAPWIIKARIMFQKTWDDENMQWDDLLPFDLNKEWEEWRDEARRTIEIVLPRLCCNPKEKRWLAVMNDASAAAFGSAVYIVGEKESHLIFAKGKPTPARSSAKVKANKPLSIARLELAAIVVGARLAEFIKSSFPKEFFYKVRFFTDSIITYYRAKRGHMHYSTWVSNRLKEYEQKGGAENLRHIAGNLNSSDILSRGSSIQELQNNVIWFTGPSFLLQPEDKWPTMKALSRKEAWEILGADFEQAEEGETPKIKSGGKPAAAVRALAVPPSLPPTELWYVRFQEYYSTWSRLIRATACIIRYLRFVLRKCTAKRKLDRMFSNWERAINNPSFDGEKRVASQTADEVQNDLHSLHSSYLTAQDRAIAEFFWIRRIQASAFADELANPAILAKTFAPKRVQIDLNGLIRRRTRLELSETLPLATIYPVILPKQNWLTELLIRYLHEMGGHLPKQSSYFNLRLRFALQGGKHELNRILYKCRHRLCNPPRQWEQRLAPLPKERSEFHAPFDVIMTDFAGPFDVVTKYQEGGKWKASKRKGYACLFTCLHTRAVAIELTEDLSTASFFRAFIRAIARNGRPRVCYSDNFKSYKAADKHLKYLYRTIDWNEIASRAAEQCAVEWRFGIELSAQGQGSVERLIRSFKSAFKKSFSNQNLTPMQLSTAFAEAEQYLNDRPLTMPEGADDSSLPITPSLLTRGRLLTMIPQDPARQTDEGAKTVLARMMIARRLLQTRLWETWQRDYLLQFQVSKLSASRRMPQIKVGQVVLLREKNLNINSWRLVRVEKLHVGSDGLVRRVTVRTSRGFLDRHINDLAFLEGDIPSIVPTDPVGDDGNVPPAESAPRDQKADRRVTRGMTKAGWAD